MFVVGVGIVWGILQLLTLALQGQQLDAGMPTLGFVVALALSVAMGMERFTMKKIIATICAALSIFPFSRVS